MKKLKKGKKGKKKRRIVLFTSVFVLILVLTTGNRVLSKVKEPNNSNEHKVSVSKEDTSLELSEHKENTVNSDKNTTVSNEEKGLAKESMNNNLSQSRTGGSKSDYKVNYREVFKQDLFIGDSITEAISEFDFLDEENVHARLGLGLVKADEEIKKIKDMPYKRVFILLGINDMSDDWTTPKIFFSRYKNLITDIRKKSTPKIYIQSIFPVTQTATKSDKYLTNEKISAFNEALKTLAKEEGATYLNIASIVDDNSKGLYEPDGIHFKKDFYDLWLNYIEKNCD